jgi:endonuclease/exonuclease/phosphatase (EEP) superfamily protein YafD
MPSVSRVLKSLVYVDVKRRKRLLWYEAWFAISAVHFLLLIAWLFPGTFDTSSHAAVWWTWAMMMIRILYFQMGLLLLVIGAVAALMHHFRMAALCVPVVLLTVVWPFFNFGTHKMKWDEGQKLRIISANLLMINTDTQPILDEIAAANADIVFLQEYTAHWGRAFHQRFHGDYPYEITEIAEDSFGGAIFSRLPFVTPPIRDNSLGQWKMTQLRAVVHLHGTPVLCQNIHLMPPRTFNYTVEHFDEMRDFIHLLSNENGRPTIIAGDFNFTGSTLQAHTIEAAGFHDAFVEAGTGRGTTWPVNAFFRYLPSLRLDHIFLSPQIECQRIATGNGYGSDHRPLVADLWIQPKP